MYKTYDNRDVLCCKDKGTSNKCKAKNTDTDKVVYVEVEGVEVRIE